LKLGVHVSIGYDIIDNENMVTGNLKNPKMQNFGQHVDT
jgi:hypothetical protein